MTNTFHVISLNHRKPCEEDSEDKKSSRKMQHMNQRKASWLRTKGSLGWKERRDSSDGKWNEGVLILRGHWRRDWSCEMTYTRKVCGNREESLFRCVFLDRGPRRPKLSETTGLCGRHESGTAYRVPGVMMWPGSRRIVLRPESATGADEIVGSTPQFLWLNLASGMNFCVP